MNIVERIEELCKKDGTTINALENRLELGHSSIQKWSAHAPRADRLYIVSKYFNVSMEYLLTGTERNDFNERILLYARLLKTLPEDYQNKVIEYTEDQKTIYENSAKKKEVKLNA